MTTVLAGACVSERIGTGVGQAQRVIQLAVGQQPSIGGHHTAPKLKYQTAVKIEPQRNLIRVTRRVRHPRLARSPTRY
jgi:hypothetical protein